MPSLALIDGITRQCGHCKQVKVTQDFYESSKSHCIDCIRVRKRQYLSTPDGKKNRSRTVYRNNMKRHHGIDSSQFLDELMKSQNGRCAICERELVGVKYDLDHNHTTGQLRGFLCYKCNSGIGFLNDDTTILEKAINYLRRYEE